MLNQLYSRYCTLICMNFNSDQMWNLSLKKSFKPPYLFKLASSVIYLHNKFLQLLIQPVSNRVFLASILQDPQDQREDSRAQKILKINVSPCKRRIPMCIAGREGSALEHNVCAHRLAIFRQKASYSRARRTKGGDELGRNGETVDTYETLHNSVEREGHLVRVRGTNYFPILWPAKI